MIQKKSMEWMAQYEKKDLEGMPQCEKEGPGGIPQYERRAWRGCQSMRRRKAWRGRRRKKAWRGSNSQTRKKDVKIFYSKHCTGQLLMMEYKNCYEPFSSTSLGVPEDYKSDHNPHNLQEHNRISLHL